MLKKGGGGGGVEELQLPYLAFCGVFFTGGHTSLIMSSFIQEYEWLTTAKREIWRNGIGKMYNYIFHFLPAN